MLLIRPVFQIGRPSICRDFPPGTILAADQRPGFRTKGANACATCLPEPALPHLLHKNASPLHTNSCAGHTNGSGGSEQKSVHFVQNLNGNVHACILCTKTCKICSLMLRSEFATFSWFSKHHLSQKQSPFFRAFVRPFFFFRIAHIHLSSTLCVSAKVVAAY